MNVEWLHYRWKVFQWHVQRINGHDMRALLYALEECDQVKGRPHVIVADTHKGYLGDGTVFMGGGHNPVIKQENFDEGVAFLANLEKSYGSR